MHLNTPPIEAVEGDQVLEDRLVGYDAFGVLLTGLVNGLNLVLYQCCYFSLSILMARNVSPLKMGFTFIAGKFITYFLLGTLFFNIFKAEHTLV